MVVLVGDLQRAHGLDHGLHGRDDVLVDQPGEAPLVLVRVAPSVDDPHLLDEGALPALAGSWPSNTGDICLLLISCDPLGSRLLLLSAGVR